MVRTTSSIGLGLLAIVGLAWTFVAMKGPHPVALGAAVGLTACAVAWPLLEGWRFGEPRFVACPACGTMMRRRELPNGLCPACMANPQ